MTLKSLKANSASSVLPGKTARKSKSPFPTIKILANDPRLLEKDTAFNVEWFEH